MGENAVANLLISNPQMFMIVSSIAKRGMRQELIKALLSKNGSDRIYPILSEIVAVCMVSGRCSF